MRNLVSYTFTVIGCSCLIYFIYIIFAIGIVDERESVLAWVSHAIVFGIFLWIPMIVHTIYLTVINNITLINKRCIVLTSTTILIYFTTYIVCAIFKIVRY